MNLLKIAWRSIQQRAFASTLTAISMALGVMLVVAVINGYALLKRTFDTSRSLPYNLIVGAKGGDLQMVLNTVYHLSKPVENIPYTFYLDFVSKQKRADGQTGLYSEYVDVAVPVCLGDYYRQFRAIGTSPAFFKELGPTWDKPFEFQAGGPFQQQEFFTAVVGATVAREAGLKAASNPERTDGSKIRISHGAQSGDVHKDEFTVVGILAPTGTPVDRGVYVNIEGFYLLENHARPEKKTEEGKPGEPTHSVEKPEPVEHNLRPLPLAQREVTAILIRTSSAYGLPELMAPELIKIVNKDTVGRAVEPVREITGLFGAFVDPLLLLLLALTITVVIVSGLSVLVSIYNSMSERQHEIAVMRALGANRQTVMIIVLLESILLSLGGGLLGWVGGHLFLAAAGPAITANTGIPVPLLQFSPLYELILVVGLVVLASVVGFMPALSAYRTDVAKALTATP